MKKQRRIILELCYCKGQDPFKLFRFEKKETPFYNNMMLLKATWCSWTALVLCYLSVCDAVLPSIVMTMICRDEEVNFKENLAKWIPVVDYYVFVVDQRTTDNSVTTIKQILDSGHKEYKIVLSEFTGFGQARTLSLAEAWSTFPQATHVLIADPDWMPDVTTMDKNDLQSDADVFRFTVYDRSGFTKRRIDWFLRHRAGLAMRYHLHEVLDIGAYSNIKYIDWVAHEIERPGSWHTTVGHGNSVSIKRHEFDLQLLAKDLQQYGHDPHTHYYLGITHQAVAQGLQSAGADMSLPENRRHVDEALRYLHLRVESQYADEFAEERWGCMYMLGVTYASIRVSFPHCDSVRDRGADSQW